MGLRNQENKMFPMNRTSMSKQVGLIRVQTQYANAHMFNQSSISHYPTTSLFSIFLEFYY